MIVTFNARVCAITMLEDVETFVIVLANDPDNPSESLEIQQSFNAYDEQDTALGMDSYCIVTSFGGTCYGCITSCILSNSRLNLLLTPEAEEELGLQGYEILLTISESDIELLRSSLARVFMNDKHSPTTLEL